MIEHVHKLYLGIISDLAICHCCASPINYQLPTTSSQSDATDIEGEIWAQAQKYHQSFSSSWLVCWYSTTGLNYWPKYARMCVQYCELWRSCGTIVYMEPTSLYGAHKFGAHKVEGCQNVRQTVYTTVCELWKLLYNNHSLYRAHKVKGCYYATVALCLMFHFAFTAPLVTQHVDTSVTLGYVWHEPGSRFYMKTTKQTSNSFAAVDIPKCT